MNTNNTITAKLTNRIAITIKDEATIWDVLLDGVIIGSIHGQTRQQAEDSIAIWKMKGLTIAPTTYKAI